MAANGSFPIQGSVQVLPLDQAVMTQAEVSSTPIQPTVSIVGAGPGAPDLLTRRAENLANLARLQASLCLYLSARHIDEVQATLLEHYPDDTPVAIGYRVSWSDQWLQVVPLKDMAKASQERDLIRTTLYLVSPALAHQGRRSLLYSPSHDHLFRPHR